MLSCIVCKEEKSEQDISLESDDTVCIDCDEEVKTDEIQDEVNDMSLSDALGVLLEAGRTDLESYWDSIQEFLIEQKT